MLSQALRTRTRQHTSIFRLHIHRHFNHTLTPTSEQDAPTPDLVKKKKRTALIRTWKPFHNMADAWALVRAVERKYGKVVEAQFIKDWEINSKYQMNAYIVFLDPKSVENIPKEGYTFHIPAPVIEDRPGGIGLDDIRHLLDSEDRDKSFDFQSALTSYETKAPERIIGGRITPAPKEYYTFPVRVWTWPNKGLMREFLRWRGFHKLEPIEASRDIRESEWFEKPDSEQVRMRAAVQWCARILEHPNPAVICKLTAHENDGKESDSSPASASMDSPESSLPESSSPTTLDIPISQSTSKSTQSSSLPTESPQPSSQSPPEPTVPTIPPSKQLTPEQKKTMQKQMSKAKQLMAKTKQPAAKKAGKSKKKVEEEPKDQMVDESPEEQQQSKGIVASIWKFFGR